MATTELNKGKHEGWPMEELTKTQFRNQFLVRADVSHLQKAMIKYLEIHGYTVYACLGRLFLLDRKIIIKNGWGAHLFCFEVVYN